LLRRITGSHPACVVAGILLLSKARTFGQPLKIELIIDDSETQLVGPIIFRNVQISCFGVSHIGNIVVGGGASDSILRIITTEWGILEISRTINNSKKVSQILFSILKKNIPSRHYIINAFKNFGIVLEPFVLDILFQTNMSSP